MWARFASSLVFVACAAIAGPAAAQDTLRGVALVVGQSDYEHLNDLANTGNDAREIGKLLNDLGFEVDTVLDGDARKLTKSLDRFAEDAEEADVALLYYSGHGIEAGGENFLVPVDADLSSLEDANKRLVPLTEVLGEVQKTAPVVIILLDACRSNPFPADALVRMDGKPDGFAISSEGLAGSKGAVSLKATQQQPSDGSLATVVGFAAEPGRVALDGTGTNSPYANALLKHLAAGGYNFADVMTMVTEEVYLETGTRQRPWTNASLRRLLYFGQPVDNQDGDEALIRGERRKLLLTISATPQPAREIVETIAAEDQVPLSQLYGMLKVLEVDTANGPEQLDKQLRAGALQLKEIIAKRDTVEKTDAELIRLSGLADKAEQEGAISLALSFRTRASQRADTIGKAIDEAEADVKQRRIELAATYASHAQTAILNFDHRLGAEKYAEAFQQVEKWDHDLAFKYKLSEANALKDRGNYKGDNAALEHAIEGYKLATTLVPRDRYALEWARAQNNLGVALTALGERRKGTEQLNEAVGVYREVLGLWTREANPSGWALVQNNLGSVLDMLGRREPGIERLEESVVAYRSALEVRTREAAPIDWALTQNNLGSVLDTIGRRQNGTARLQEAVTAYRAALEVRTRETAPFEWALTQNNLGLSLWTLGSRQRENTGLEQAIAAFRASLEERTREKVPLDWAMTQHNLGAALSTLGSRQSGTEALEASVTAYRSALEERTRERVPLDWALTQSNLGMTLWSLGLREVGTEKLEQAVAAYQASLEERTRERLPLDWAVTQHNLGSALWTLGERLGDNQRLEQSVAAYRAALEERTRSRVPLDWALTQNNLGTVLWSLGLRENNPARFEEAIGAYRASLEERTHERVPLDWAMTQHNLALAIHALGMQVEGTAKLEEAVVAFHSALEERTREHLPLDWAITQNELGRTLLEIGRRNHDRQALIEARAAISGSWEVHHDAGYVQYDNYFAESVQIIDQDIAANGGPINP